MSIAIIGLMVTAGCGGNGTPGAPAPTISTNQNQTGSTNNVSVVSLALTPTNPAAMGVGRTLQVTAIATFIDGSSQVVSPSASWTSSNPAVATVNSGGSVFGVGAGTTAIRCSFSGVTSNSATLTVLGITNVAVSPASPPSIGVGGTQQFVATATFSDGTSQDVSASATWVSGNTAIATVNPSGLATSLASGTTTIQATYAGTPSGKVNLTVRSAAIQSLSVTPINPAAILVGATRQFDAVATFTDGITQNVTNIATWSSSNQTVARLNASGLASGLAPGTISIQATLSGISSNAVNLTVQSVAVQSIAITPASPAISVGGSLQFNAVATFNNGSTQNVTTNAVWGSSNQTVATINAGGMVSGLASGTTAIRATFQSVSASVNLTVQPAPVTLQSVSIANTSAIPLVVGGTSQFTATASFSDGHTESVTSNANITWTTTNSTVAIITNGGMITGIAAGTATIRATFQGVASNSITVIVSNVTGLVRLNQLRAFARLGPVTENATFTDGCQKHAIYMVKNQVVVHAEDPSKPFFTSEGNTAGTNSNVIFGGGLSNVGQAIDLLMMAPFHGIGFLDPRLQQSGFGFYAESGLAGGAVDVIRGLAPAVPAGVTFPILWPASGQTVPFRQFSGGEYPNPLPHTGFTAPTGMPIYVQIGTGSQIPNVTAVSVQEQGGAALEVSFFHEANFTNPDPAQQSLGRAVLNSRDAIVILPRNPLTAGRTYNCSITVNGVTTAWSFSVAVNTLLRAEESGQTPLILSPKRSAAGCK